MSDRSTLRCAIYTRKSSEEGLEQDFNSLEAQREACEAYVRSQAREGWKLIPDRFDDGGFSGGNLQRPALADLMEMVRAGKVDVIVIYKIDRLTRSLTDFARLAETFDKHGVSFVSVTQQFNTTTSMGRLMLNVLLSFAQFEREITGERIRDKIAASKKKGMWMGGNVPIGYDVIDRRLVVNPLEAEIVRRVFQLYLQEGNVPKLLERLQQEDIRTAQRTSGKGQTSGNRPFTRGHLYKLLSSPIYIGRVAHRDQSHPGQHEAIVDQPLWAAVQAQLASNNQGPRTRRRRAAARRHLLGDILQSADGHRFIATHANKGSRQYRYYVEELPPAPTNSEAATRPVVRQTRLPAREIERSALSALAGVLRDKHQLLLAMDDVHPGEVAGMIETSTRIATLLELGPGATQARLLREIVARVEYRREALTLHLSTTHLRSALGLSAQNSEWPSNQAGGEETFAVRTPLSIRYRGEQMKLVMAGKEPSQPPDCSLVTAVVRAHRWAGLLIDGSVESIGDLARREGIGLGYIHQVLPLAFLAPDIIERILAGRHGPNLTANQLIWATDRPIMWKGQIHVLATA